MTMPTSIFNVITQPVSSLASSLSGIPAAASAALSEGVNGVLGSLTGGFGPLGASGQGAIDGRGSPLRDFLEEIKTRGLAWGNRFHCKITPPLGIAKLIDESPIGDLAGRTNTDDSHHLMLRCDMSELPGYNFTTSEIKTFGPIRRMPNQVIYSDLTLSFICSLDMAERYFFDYWGYLMRDTNNLYGYYDDYVTDIEVSLFSNIDPVGPIYGVKFIEAWPIAVTPIQLSWQDQEYIRLTVSFAYHRWEPQGYPAPVFNASTAGNGLSLNTTQNILSNFAFGILPSIPHGAQILGIAGMSTRDMLRGGISLVGSGINTRDPISRTIIGSGISTINQVLGSGGGQ